MWSAPSLQQLSAFKIYMSKIYIGSAGSIPARQIVIHIGGIIMRIENLNITQQSVNDFFDEIDTDALVESLKLSFDEHSVIVSD